MFPFSTPLISLLLKKWIPVLVFSFAFTIYLADGHKIIYDREVPFELRIQDASTGPQEVGTLEAIKVKLLVLVILFSFIFP